MLRERSLVRKQNQLELLSLVLVTVACLSCVPRELGEQTAAEAAAADPWAHLEESAPPNSEAQMSAAVTAAPSDLRDEATVLGRGEGGALAILRRGSNELVCLADDPSDERFQVSCYHVALETYMARGRELRAEGISGPDNLAARHAEIDAGTLPIPRTATMVYTLGGPLEMHDAVSGEVDESLGRRVYATYIAYATEESTGLSTTPPQKGAPWIMRPGTPTSHVMVVIDPEAPAPAGAS